MEKAILISLHPEWAFEILMGLKRVEVRKSYPKQIPVPFRCYVYATYNGAADITLRFGGGDPFRFSGNVIGEFVVDEITKIDPPYLGKEAGTSLTPQDLCRYSAGKQLYGWHISSVKGYDKPLQLSDLCVQYAHKDGSVTYKPIQHPPMSWQYVWKGDQA